MAPASPRIAGLLLLAAYGPGLPALAAAQSPVADEIRVWARRYHEDPARLDSLRTRMREAAAADPRPDNLRSLAQISLIWGDIRARTTDERLEVYDEGRRAAQRAVELEPRSAVGHFLYGANAGRWGQVKGVARSLFLLPSVRRAADAALELDPRLLPAYALAGNLFYEVPALLGGDLDRAERMFRKGLELDAHFTPLRLGLAKVLVRKGRTAEARRELQAVLDDPAPENPAQWALRDTGQARALLAAIQERS